MQPLTEAAPGRRVFSLHAAEEAADAAPAALLLLAQIVALAEKRLRWYGFADWRVKDILCHRGPTVSVMVRGPAGAVMTMTVERDGGRTHIETGIEAGLETAGAAQQAVATEFRSAHDRRSSLEKRGETGERSARFGRSYGPTAREYGRRTGYNRLVSHA